MQAKNTEVEAKKIDALSLIYVIALGVLTLGVIIFTICYLTEPFAAKKLKHLDDIEANEVLEQRQSNYYVFLYTSDFEDDDMYVEVSEKLVEYENYCRDNKDTALHIYLVKADESDNADLLTLFDEDDIADISMPVLFSVKDGAIQTTQYATASSVLTQLATLMK